MRYTKKKKKKKQTLKSLNNLKYLTRKLNVYVIQRKMKNYFQH